MTSATAVSTSHLPLARLYRRLGVPLGPLDEGGAAVPLRHAGVAAEHATATRAVGLADRSGCGRLELLGEDRHRFLNAYVTCDVKGLAPGETAYGFFTNPQGRILADVTVLALPDRLWLELPPGREEAIAEHLRRYVLADRVEVLPLTDMVPLALLGPRAEELLAGMLGKAWEGAAVEHPGDVAAGHHARAFVLGTEVTLERRPAPGGEGESWILWVSASIAPPLWESLLEHGAAAGLAPMGWEALEILRVERGTPRYGRDFGLDNFPQETGLAERGVSYTKGCYLGQEVVARIHYRGGVQKALRGLLFEGPAPRPGAALSLDGPDGKTVGAATTIVDSPALGRTAGLGILHQRGAEPGTRLSVEGGGTAEVRALPLVTGG